MTRSEARKTRTEYLTHDYGPKLRAWRTSKGLSLREAADLFDSSKTMLSDIENGKEMPGRELATRIEKMAKLHCRCSKCGQTYKRRYFFKKGESK